MSRSKQSDVTLEHRRTRPSETRMRGRSLKPAHVPARLHAVLHAHGWKPTKTWSDPDELPRTLYGKRGEARTVLVIAGCGTWQSCDDPSPREGESAAELRSYLRNEPPPKRRTRPLPERTIWVPSEPQKAWERPWRPFHKRWYS